jgi:type I restriction enzyme S subunit
VSQLHRHPEHRGSSRDWLGEVRAGWPILRVKQVFTVVNGATPSSSEGDYWDGDIPWVTPEDLGRLRDRHLSASARLITKTGYDSCGTTLVPAGSVVLSTRAPIGHLALAARELSTNQGCRSLIARRPVEASYFYYQLVAAKPELESWGQGSTFKELAKSHLEAVPIIVPPIDEQRAIAAFLDRATAKIDGLAAKKERIIGLLQEKRTALITRAVTKGLDPNAPMKESGMAWLGAIPMQWTLTPAMRLTALDRPIMYGIVLPGPNVQDGVPIVKGGDVAPGGLRRDSLGRTTFEIEAGYVRSRLRGGDIVYAIRGSIGAAEIVPDELEGANLTQDAARISPASGFNAMWLLFVLRSPPVFAQLEARATGATIRGINIRDLKRACIPVPPRIEQDAIAAFLDRETNKIDALIAKVREAIERLKEYRTALVSAAVTGKIDVRQRAETDPENRTPNVPFSRSRDGSSSLD